MRPEDLFAAHPLALALVERVRATLAEMPELGPVEIRTSKSQVAFRRRRGFAYVWRPGRYLRHPAAEAVLSIALPRRIDSARWKEVVEPAPGRWIHHLEVDSVSEIDPEIVGWLAEAARGAG
jgi:hypothetical protein